MDSTEITNINLYFVLVTFLVPGIIMIQLRRCVTPVHYNYFSTEFLNFIPYIIVNTICYVVLSRIFNWVNISDLLNIQKVLQDNWGCYLIFIFVIPFFLGVVLGWIDKSKIMQQLLGIISQKKVASNILTTWEEYFGAGDNQSNDMIIKLKNGDIICGYFGGNSMISGSVTNKDIYLEKITKINNDVLQDETSAWINGNDIEYILLSNDVVSEEHILLQIFDKVYSILAEAKDIKKILQDICAWIKQNKKNNVGQNNRKKGDAKNE